MKTLSIVVISAIITASCSSNITANPKGKTDYVVGKVYVLQKPTYLWDGDSLLPLRGKEPADSDGIVPKGAKIAVRKVVWERGGDAGTFIVVFAEILTGDQRGKVVSITAISDTSKYGYTKRNPALVGIE